jgi:hypothetical protein
MSAVKVLAVVLIVIGCLGLLTGGFSYTRETQKAKLGPITISAAEKVPVEIPLWVGGVSLVAGLVLLFTRK